MANETFQIINLKLSDQPCKICIQIYCSDLLFSKFAQVAGDTLLFIIPFPYPLNTRVNC